MIRLLHLLLILFSAKALSQNKITVLSSDKKQPIRNASVYCDDLLLGKTNSQGLLSYSTKCKKIEILASNYIDEMVEVKKNKEVFLKPSSEKSNNIDRIVINDKSDARALKILDEFHKREKENTPKSLDSYEFKSYSKLSIDLDKDSLDIFKNFLERRKDSLSSIQKPTFKQKKGVKKDSLMEEDFLKTATESQMFLWEKATEYKYSQKYGEKTNIIDNRMSGFKNPLYEALAINISNLDRVPRQLKQENRKLFNYYLSDTIQIEGRKTYVIKFKEITNKKKQNPRKFNGKIYIDAETYALKKYESFSKKINDGNIVSVWKPINNKWFLDSEDLKIRMGEQAFKTSKIDSLKPGEKPQYNKKKFGSYLIVKNRFFDFKINPSQDASEYKGYSVEIKNTDGSLLHQYRTDTLTTRESATYVKIDSFMHKNNFERKVNFLTNILKGNLRYKMIDFDITKFFKYDLYEGVRLGSGIKLNEKFSKTFSPDAYFAYGFKDHTWKYGLGIDLKLSNKKTSIFRIEFLDDVFAAGRFSNKQWPLLMRFADINMDIYNANFYRNRKLGATYTYDLSNALTVQLGFHSENQIALFDYNYQDLGNEFRNTNTSVSLKYSPRDKNVMTPSGKLTIERKFPQVFINYENGGRFLGGDLSYHKIDALFIHQLKTKIGYSNIKIFGGITSGNAPIWKNLEIAGQTKNNLEWHNKLNTPTNFAFVTMPSGNFYTDKFIAFQLSQELPVKFKTLGKRYSSISIEYQSAIGGFKSHQDHYFNFQVLDHYYQEAGFVWNNFLGTRFGLGLSYRLGHYQTTEVKDNIGIQVKFGGF